MRVIVPAETVSLRLDDATTPHGGPAEFISGPPPAIYTFQQQPPFVRGRVHTAVSPESLASLKGRILHAQSRGKRMKIFTLGTLGHRSVFFFSFSNTFATNSQLKFSNGKSKLCSRNRVNK